MLLVAIKSACPLLYSFHIHILHILFFSSLDNNVQLRKTSRDRRRLPLQQYVSTYISNSLRLYPHINKLISLVLSYTRLHSTNIVFFLSLSPLRLVLASKQVSITQIRYSTLSFKSDLSLWEVNEYTKRHKQAQYTT